MSILNLFRTPTPLEAAKKELHFAKLEHIKVINHRIHYENRDKELSNRIRALESMVTREESIHRVKNVELIEKGN